ncbi:MAG: hypothetical protein KBD37_02060 [Burkholderiales bacterium]|nr:hypothetical protein [Burkholderiales bacterium]
MLETQVDNTRTSTERNHNNHPCRFLEMGAGLLCCTVAAISRIPFRDLFAAQLELYT